MSYRDDLAERAMELLARIGREAPAGATDAEVAMWLAERYAELFDADYCRFWWVETDRTRARVLAHHPPIEFKEDWEHIKQLNDGKATLVSTVINSGSPHIEKDAASAAGAESRYITVYGAKSGAHIPLFVDGSSVGDMAMVSKRELAHFDEEDLPVFHALASCAAALIESAKRASR